MQNSTIAFKSNKNYSQYDKCFQNASLKEDPSYCNKGKEMEKRRDYKVRSTSLD